MQPLETISRENFMLCEVALFDPYTFGQQGTEA